MVNVFLGDRWASVDERELKEVCTIHGSNLYIYDCGDHVAIVWSHDDGSMEVIYAIEKGNREV